MLLYDLIESFNDLCELTEENMVTLTIGISTKVNILIYNIMGEWFMSAAVIMRYNPFVHHNIVLSTCHRIVQLSYWMDISFQYGICSIDH